MSCKAAREFFGLLIGLIGLGTVVGAAGLMMSKRERNLWADVAGGLLLLTLLAAAVAVGVWVGNPTFATIILAGSCLLAGLGMGVLHGHRHTHPNLDARGVAGSCGRDVSDHRGGGSDHRYLAYAAAGSRLAFSCPVLWSGDIGAPLPGRVYCQNSSQNCAANCSTPCEHYWRDFRADTAVDRGRANKHDGRMSAMTQKPEQSGSPGWTVGQSITTELDVALAAIGGGFPLPATSSEFQALHDSAPEDAVDWSLFLEDPSSVSVLGFLSGLTETKTEADYGRATLAMRDLTVETALARLTQQAASLDLTPDPDLAAPEALADLSARATLVMQASIGLDVDGGAVRVQRHRQEVLRITRLLRERANAQPLLALAGPFLLRGLPAVAQDTRTHHQDAGEPRGRRCWGRAGERRSGARAGLATGSESALVLKGLHNSVEEGRLRGLSGSNPLD